MKTTLDECPNSPNCVSTQTAQREKRMLPIPYRGDPQRVKDILKKIVLSLPRTRLVEENAHYLHFTFKSLVFGFVDDVEFLLDPATQVIHFRSASRVGYSDLGVNRKRMQDLIQRLTQRLNGEEVGRVF